MESSRNALQSGGGRKKGKPGRRLLLAIANIAMVALIANQLGLFNLLKGGSLKERVERLDGMFQSLGVWAPAFYILIWILSCTLLLPGLPITIAGALVFGAVWGTVYTAIGANIGACAAFLVGRYAVRSMVEGWIKKNKSLMKIDEGVRQQGWRMLMITRFVPLFPFSLQNYVYGLTNIPFRTYALVTIPTILPGTIAFNFAAGSAREVILSGGQPEALKRTVLYLAIAAVFFVLVSVIAGRVKKRY
ncbi:MAG: TVP38/TMEM64 family protein, partial [Deltaproteobacteria bacterium]|nr:TVP38/TMEM64 family protein [Deltaproteobacteria bacterium]